MKIGFPCKLGEELVKGYTFIGFDRGIYTAVLYAKRPSDEESSFFREDLFEPKYVLELPLGIEQKISNLGVEKKSCAELWGIIWDGKKVWGDFVFPQQSHAHEKYSTDVINSLLKDILPNKAA